MVLQALVLIVERFSQPEMAVLFLFLTAVSCSPFWWRFPALFSVLFVMQDLTSRKRKKETPVHLNDLYGVAKKNVEFRLKSGVVSLSLPPSLSLYFSLSIYLSLFLSLSLSTYLSFFLSLSLSLSLSLYLSIYLVNRCWVLLTPCSVPVVSVSSIVSAGSVNPWVYVIDRLLVVLCLLQSFNEKRSAWTCWGSGVKLSHGSTSVGGDRMTPLIHFERQRWKKVNFFAKKPLPRSLLQHVQTLCMPSFIDLHTHATAGHV